MKPKAKQTRATQRPATGADSSGVYVVPSHGRLARRGSTEIIEDEAADGGSFDRSGEFPQ